MATELKHFKGKYLGYFTPGKTQQVNANKFHELAWESIEIRDLESIEKRSVDAEKVGDFIFIPILKSKPKSKSARLFKKGIDVVIIKCDQEAFSEDLHNVILRNQSGSRLDTFNPIRVSTIAKINDYQYCITGEIYFSIPIEIPVMPSPPTTIPSTILPNAPIGVGITRQTVDHIPNLTISPQPGIERSLQTSFTSNMGCLGLIWKLFKWYLIISLVYTLFSFLSGWIGRVSGENQRLKTDDGAVQSDKPRLNPKQDTLSSSPWDYLTAHRVEWSDFIANRFLAKYTTSSLNFEDSQKQHAPWANPQTDNALTYWNGLYSSFSSHDSPKLDSLTQYLDSERKRQQFDAVATAEMVITFIQEIPYCLVHDGTCKEVIQMGGFVQEYHEENKPCLPQIIGGVQSPYEFIHNLKGDCDTRSLLGYTILSRLGIPASIWVSEVYGHSVLGVGVPGPVTNIKSVNGFRHAGVELTAKGFRLGMLSPSHSNMNNWDVVLFKNP